MTAVTHEKEPRLPQPDATEPQPTVPKQGRTVRPVRLRIGVALILFWWLPFWILSAPIADLLGGPSSGPSVATVTAVIVVVQTLAGLIGLVAAGAEVKAILHNSTKRQAIKIAWSVLIHGKIPEHDQGSASGSDAAEPPTS
ncbi:hypothetical protein FOE78_17565 [Microlunatus elymi]|uniref:Uncharacterized protein n=1 Tax=Microlunatus elymi TaxID=2596828 RepID=A0A516Q217_9ACTN|nr:hypothetical protein [Microlunatus elymi]QDP97480.1 hypothetical protein FOE78_17565 [Microlunatus elymi]